MNAPAMQSQGEQRDEGLIRRWLALGRTMDLRGDVLQAGRELIRCYDQPHRRYHNLDHLWDCLGVFSEHDGLAHDPAAAEAALWFHDAVYEVGAGDNEARSAEMARDVLEQMGLEAARIQAIAGSVLATDHRSPPDTADARLVCDVDLSILGQGAQKYDAYAAAIRAEAGLPDREFNRRRAGFLRAMLARPHVFHTDAFRGRFEAAARRYMRRELNALTGSLAQEKGT